VRLVETETAIRFLRPDPWRWPRPRVLVEHPDELAGLQIANGLRYAGFAVSVCSGPEHAGQCPLTVDDGCAVAHGADVVVSCLGYDRPVARDVLGALRARCATVPLVVEVPKGTEIAPESLLADCRIVTAPAAVDDLVSAVRGLLDGREASDA